MRYAILFSLTVLSVQCIGQMDSCISVDAKPTTIDSIYHIDLHRQTDTVKVVMLVSDTARSYWLQQYSTFDSVSPQGNQIGRIGVDTIYLGYNHGVTWVIGLEVTGLPESTSPFMCYAVDPHGKQVIMDMRKPVHLKYLSSTGKELPKGYVVWQSIKTKQP